MRKRAAVALVLMITLIGAATVGSGLVTEDGAEHPHAGDGATKEAITYLDGNPSIQSGAESATAYDQVIDIRLQHNGDARWTVTVYEPLESESEVEAFRDLGERWEADVSSIDFGPDLFRQFAELASDSTERTMVIPDDSVRRTASIEGDTGVLELSFTWTNFARQDGNRLIVDDAFQAHSGTWLPRLETGQALVIRPPPGFVIVDSPPGPGVANQTIRWSGPTTFSDTYFVDDPIVYWADVTPTPTDVGTITETPPAGTSPPPTGSDIPRGLIFGIAAALLVGAAMVAYRSTGGEVPIGTGGTREGKERGDEQSEELPPDPSTPSQDEEPNQDDDAGIDEELLSDEERVLSLLESNGGRMKQANIVKETDWSNAKVSQLLSSMAADDEIDKLRIGRENLISLPEVDIEDPDE